MNALQKALKQKLDDDELMNCMRCGFCLPSCPTYVQTNQNEAASPRGRIALMKGVVDGVIEPDEAFEQQLNLCLGCRACEPVCPSGVKYGHLLEEARDVLESKKKRSWPVRLLRYFFFQKIFPKKRNLRRLLAWLWVYQRSGLRTLLRKTGVFKRLGNLGNMEKTLPDIPSPKEMKRRPVHLRPKQPPTRTVAFFSGCLMDTMFMSTNDKTIELLLASGCEVFVPQAQVCCGALHAHSGEKRRARDLAKKNIAVFERLDADAIVTNAGGCGAMLTEYEHLLQDEPEWRTRAKRFADKIKDISEILVELKFHERELSLPSRRITYQDSCHLRNVMRTSEAPRTLLNSIKEVTFVEMHDADQCCGSAGIYNLVQQEMSMQILDEKMSNVERTKASTIASGNPGCLMQMKLGIERAGAGDRMQAVHIADLLYEAFSKQ